MEKFVEELIREIEYVYWIYGWPKEKAKQKAIELVLRATAKSENA